MLSDEFNFLLGSQTVILTVLLFWFISFDASICSTMAFLPLGNSDHVVVSVSIDFPSYSQWHAHFIALLMTLLMLIGVVFLIIWEMFHGRISLNSVPLLQQNSLAAEFWEWVQVGTDVYIPHWKYQVKYHSFPWFSAAFTAAIVHRNHFFRFYQKSKSYESQHLNFSSKAIGKIIAEAEKIIYLGSASGIFFADVIKQISVFALAIPLVIFESYFGNVILFN